MDQFLESLKTAYNQLDYEGFCEKCGFTPSQYALDKFVALKRTVEGLCSFDNDTLRNLIS